MQGISFKMGDYKYKGSEIDRRFSINNLQKILQQQQSEKLIQSPSALFYSKSIAGNKQPEIDKDASKDINILDELLKPEQRDQSLHPQWRFQKKRKKKSMGRHL